MMDKSLEGISSPLLFLQDRKLRKSMKKGLPSRALASKKFLMLQKRKLHRGNSCAVFLASSTPAARVYVYAEGRFIDDDEGQLHCLCEMDEDDKWMEPSHSLSQGIIQENRGTSLPDCIEAYMSEIQLRRIVDKMATEASEQRTDGDELMVKDGKTFSKFSKDALEIGEDVDAFILGKVRKIFDLNKGDDAVFRTRNGAPKIMTKFKDKPYSYELLLPEYANGSKKFPTVKSMNCEGKTATAKVIRGLTESTLVVQRCSNPRSISRLVIVPKLAPGQPKNDPDH
jgi:hypothetical protein